MDRLRELFEDNKKLQQDMQNVNSIVQNRGLKLDETMCESFIQHTDLIKSKFNSWITDVLSYYEKKGIIKWKKISRIVERVKVFLIL